MSKILPHIMATVSLNQIINRYVLQYSFFNPINIFVQKNSFFAFFEIQFFILQVVIMSMIILVQKIKLMPKNMDQKTKAKKLLIWVRFG